MIFYQSGAEQDSDRGGSSGPGWTRSAETAGGAAGYILHRIRRASFLPGYEAATAASPPGRQRSRRPAVRSCFFCFANPSGPFYYCIASHARTHAREADETAAEPPSAPAAKRRRTAAAPARSISAAKAETCAATCTDAERATEAKPRGGQFFQRQNMPPRAVRRPLKIYFIIILYSASRHRIDIRGEYQRITENIRASARKQQQRRARSAAAAERLTDGRREGPRRRQILQTYNITI